MVAIAAAIVATPASAAYAVNGDRPVGGGGVEPDGTIVVGIEQPGANGHNGVVSIGSPAIPSPYRYVWVPAFASVYDTNPSPACPVPGETRWWRVTYDLAGNEVGVAEVCLGPNAPKPALPPVPTIADIWAFALKDIPRPALGVDPQSAGLTGLDTHLWYDGPETVSIGATIGEWTVIGTAHLVSATFDTGDGTRTAAAPRPHTNVTYERKGDRTLVITARWEADVVMTGPGVTARPTAIGAALLRTTQPYHVREVRSVLVP